MNDYPMNLGALEDTRTAEEKAKDYKAEEILASAAPVEWRPLDLSKVKVLFPKNQLYRSSCVAQTIATMKSRKLYREFGDVVDVSPTPVYAQRSNKPELGMRIGDAFKFFTSEGPSIESICPSEGLSEGQMNEAEITSFDKAIGKTMTSLGLFDTGFSIDAIARVMESDRRKDMAVPVMLWFRFPVNGEWWMPVPKEGNGSGDLTGHSVCGIEYGMYEGEKAIAVQESAGVSSTFEPNKKNIRIIKESYLKKHLYLAKYEAASNKPRHTFTRPMEFSTSFIVDEEVRFLQDVLKAEGVLDSSVESTGYYGSLTAKAVLAFQTKHGIPTDGLAGRRVGPKTLSVLNRIYGE